MKNFINFWKRNTVIAMAIMVLFSVPSLAENIEFDSTSTYDGKSVRLVAELTKPKNLESPPIVILLHGCGGLRPTVLRSLKHHASFLNQYGFATLILDSFGPRGNAGGWVCERTSRLADARVYRAKDVLDTIDILKTRKDIDSNNIFLMGRSNGGSTAATLSFKKGKIRAIVAYYPWCGVVPTNPAIPLLVLSGAEDDWTSPVDCKNRDSEGGNLSVIVYPDAVHSFDLDIPVITYKGHKIGNNPQATKDSRSKMTRFFREHLTQ